MRFFFFFFNGHINFYRINIILMTNYSFNKFVIFQYKLNNKIYFISIIKIILTTL